MIYVFRDGLIVPKGGSDRRGGTTLMTRSDLPAPMISRMEPFESPVTGKEISSWRERERDMAAVGAADVRDLPAGFSRGRQAQKREADHGRANTDDTFQWRDPA